MAPMLASGFVDLAKEAAPYLFGALLAGGVFVAGVRNVRLGLSIRTNPPVPAGDVGAATGVVDVEGVVRPAGETLAAPVTGEPCVGYEYDRYSRSTGNDDWTRVETDEAVVPFYVEDDTGRVVVVPDESWLDFEQDTAERGAGSRETEALLAPGDEVHVHGQRRAVDGSADEGPFVDGPFADESVYVGDGDEVSLPKVTQDDERGTARKHLVFGVLLTLVGGFFLALLVEAFTRLLG